MVPDVVPVFGSAEQPGRLGQTLAALPLPLALPLPAARFAGRRTAAELRGGAAPVVVETGGGQLTSRRPGNEVGTVVMNVNKQSFSCLYYHISTIETRRQNNSGENIL